MGLKRANTKFIQDNTSANITPNNFQTISTSILAMSIHLSLKQELHSIFCGLNLTDDISEFITNEAMYDVKLYLKESDFTNDNASLIHTTAVDCGTTRAKELIEKYKLVIKLESKNCAHKFYAIIALTSFFSISLFLLSDFSEAIKSWYVFAIAIISAVSAIFAYYYGALKKNISIDFAGLWLFIGGMSPIVIAVIYELIKPD